MMNRITKLSGLSLVLMLVFAGTALAGGTPSGTTVNNTATVDYQVGGLNQATVNSNTATFLVDNRIDLTVVTLDAANIITVPGMIDQVLSYSITNNGNTVQDYTLSAIADAGDDFDTANLNIFIDVNGNGIYDPATDTATYIDELAIDATMNAFIVSDIPLTAANAELANYDLLAETSSGATPGAQGAVYANDHAADLDDPALVQIVFADGAGSADGANDGAHSSSSTYEVASANLLVVKTHAVMTDPINGATRPKNIPGATVNYTTTLNNTGGTSADNIAVIDPIPANTGFVVGSHSVVPAGTMEYSNDSGATWVYTPVDSGDGTDPTVTHMRILIPSIAAAGGSLSTFRVIIQ